MYLCSSSHVRRQGGTRNRSGASAQRWESGSQSLRVEWADSIPTHLDILGMQTDFSEHRAKLGRASPKLGRLHVTFGRRGRAGSGSHRRTFGRIHSDLGPKSTNFERLWEMA